MKLAACLLGLLLLGSGTTAQAQCSTNACQGAHNPDSFVDVRQGDCKSGDVNGAEPLDWTSSQFCAPMSSYWYYKSWERTLTNVVHDPDCNGISPCTPCNFAFTGDCPLKPRTYCSEHRHYKTNNLGQGIYDHSWTTIQTEVCACGKHGCGG